MSRKISVLIAGIGGASLGTEILKSLLLVKNRYAIFGCDISSLAFGHYQSGFERTFTINHRNYVESVLEVCGKAHIDVIIPGGEEPLQLLRKAASHLGREGVTLAANSPFVIDRLSDKMMAFTTLAELGFKVPKTISYTVPDDLGSVDYPCVVKPSTGTGGSSLVFLATCADEAQLYATYITKNAKKAILQDYVPEDEGEFTIGVLSLPDSRLFGSVAMKRIFNSKLSVLFKGRGGLISSGYSQGLIDDFPDLRSTAENIARAVGSTGPLNIQGRVKNGQLIPFEINPRFSASTYLRAMAGFNEVDIYLEYISDGTLRSVGNIRPGYYLRSFHETFVPKDAIRP